MRDEATFVFENRTLRVVRNGTRVDIHEDGIVEAMVVTGASIDEGGKISLARGLWAGTSGGQWPSDRDGLLATAADALRG